MIGISDASLISSICGGREWSNSGSYAYDDMASKPLACGVRNANTESDNENSNHKRRVAGTVRANLTNFSKV